MRDYMLMAVMITGGLYYLYINKKNKSKKALWSFVDINEDEAEVESRSVTKNIVNKIKGKLNETDFIFIYGVKSLTFSLVISIGYYVFWCFVCSTLNFSPITFLAGSVCCFMLFFKIIKGIYESKFSDYFEAQFPYALRSISRNLAVGQTIYVAIAAAAENLSGIMQREFSRISEQLKSGVSFDNILDRGEVIYPYKGYYVFSAYLRVSIQKGSSLRETLMSLADDLVSSQVIRKKTKSLTSEARGAAKILACLPAIMLVVLYEFSTVNFIYLFTELHGKYVIIYMVISVTIGFIIIMKMIKGVQL